MVVYGTRSMFLKKIIPHLFYGTRSMFVKKNKFSCARD